MLHDIFKFIKSVLKFAGNTVLGILFLTALYLLFAVIFTLIPSNISSKQPEKGITIYIKSNGVHTDLLLPTENKFYNWSDHILQEDFFPDTTDHPWTAFGWGDKGFYLNTPNWSDLKVSTALDALLPTGSSAMHVTLYGNTLQENKRTKKIILTDEQYLILCDYVFNSFQRNEQEHFILIDCCHYKGLNDNFYEAEGSYHLFNTCNNWTNSALKAAGVKTAFWAPFDKCIFYHF
jgi:uncharacterized protein (TIGR02117 family)